MKQFLVVVLSLFALSACHKDHNNPPTPPKDSTQTGSLKIDLLAYPKQNPITVSSTELIISEPGGTILLDSIVPANTPVATTLHTNATLVNVTTVSYDTYNKQYYATTYQGVNPSTWTGAWINSYYTPLGSVNPAAEDTLFYKNLPTSVGVQFSQGVSGVQATFTAYKTYATYFHPQPGNYAYLVCPTVGLYKFYLPNKSNDTVDCTTMDTAVSASFNTSSYYAFYYAILYGYTDSTNPSTALQLYQDFDNNIPAVPQLVYPKKYIQKYRLFAQFTHNNDQEYISLYDHGTTVPTNITYPDPNQNTITASQNSHFNVSWNTTKPTYYVTSWVAAPTVAWYLYASPDSATQNAVSLFTMQKSKMLKGIDLTALGLVDFTCEYIPNYNYSSFVGMSFDSTAASHSGITNSWTDEKTTF